jgi:peptidoglycan/xylan/chitin deacetylase (PgdA/CDA1 family)
MWNGKKKAITFSFDDGVMQDIRVIEILDKYGLKGTFNLNSARWGGKTPYESSNGQIVERTVIEPWQVKDLYKNHEVAVHTQAHLNLTTIADSCVTWQVEEDRKALELLTGREIRCMAYPCGGVNNDDRVAKIIKDTTLIRKARTITSSYSFDLQDNLLRFNPTVHIVDNKLFELAEQFLALETDEPKLFYIWGHSYEFDDGDGKWERLENFCRLISGKDDIFYGTNGEVFFGK